MLTVLEYLGAFYGFLGIWFALRLAGECVAQWLERRTAPGRRA